MKLVWKNPEPADDEAYEKSTWFNCLICKDRHRWHDGCIWWEMMDERGGAECMCAGCAESEAGKKYIEKRQNKKSKK